MRFEIAKRATLLAHLYGQRLQAPSQGWVNQGSLAKLCDAPEFALEMLREQGQVERKGYAWRITAMGAIHHETETLKGE